MQMQRRLFVANEDLTDVNQREAPYIATARSIDEVRELLPWAADVVPTGAGWYAFESLDEAWAFRRIAPGLRRSH
jgi:hypothetical protein